MNPGQQALLQTTSAESKSAHLLGVCVTSHVHGLLFEAHVKQRFVNPGAQSIELVYTFPLPWGAVLLGVDVQLGEQQLSGTVVPKQQAEASYEDALSAGDAAILLEHNADDSYTLNLGNLAAGEHAIITLRYAQTLRFEQGGLRLAIPTVLAPRYGHAQNDGQLQPHQVPEHSLTAEHPFTLALHLHGHLAKARVASPSHPIQVAPADPAAARPLTVTLASDAFLDRDFVLVIDQIAQESLAIAAPVCGSSERVVLLAGLCPKLAAQPPRAAALHLLVDCSGSMAGDSIAAARCALQAVVARLEEGDAFSLSRFGSTVEHRSRGLWQASTRTRRSAQRWIASLQADMGGTEMQAALQSIFNLARNAPADILLVTDGEIWQIEDTLAAARRAGHRVFVVGVGSAPAESLLRRLAEATGGACDFVAAAEAVEPAILRMFTRLRSPCVTDVQIQWPKGALPQWTVPLPASIFSGDTVYLHALLGCLPQGAVRLLARTHAQGELQLIAQVDLPAAADAPDTVARMAAAVRIAHLAQEQDEEADALAWQLAVDYQLITEHTHFLLLHERAEEDKSPEMPQLVKVQQMAAAGWSGLGSGARSYVSDEIPAFSRMLNMRFAMADTGSSDSVLEELGRKFDETRERIRQIEAKAPRKLRHPSRAAKLRSFSERFYMQPLELSRWLEDAERADWPTNCAALRAMDIGPEAVDWLESLIAGTGAVGVSEAEVVTLFLRLMADTEVREALEQGQNAADAFRRAARRVGDDLDVRNAGAQDVVAANVQLVSAMASALRNVKARRWQIKITQ